MILTKWYQNFQITGGQLKISKCYQMLMSYRQKKNKAYLLPDQDHQLTIELDRTDHSIPYLPPTKTRCLVRVDTNPANNNLSILEAFQQKLVQYSNTLISTTLSPLEIIKGYNAFQWPSIKFMAPTLTLDPSDNILRKFHRLLLLKLGINRNIPQILISTPF